MVTRAVVAFLQYITQSKLAWNSFCSHHRHLLSWIFMLTLHWGISRALTVAIKCVVGIYRMTNFHYYCKQPDDPFACSKIICIYRTYREEAEMRPYGYIFKSWPKFLNFPFNCVVSSKFRIFIHINLFPISLCLSVTEHMKYIFLASLLRTHFERL